MPYSMSPLKKGKSNVKTIVSIIIAVALLALLGYIVCSKGNSGETPKTKRERFSCASCKV